MAPARIPHVRPQHHRRDPPGRQHGRLPDPRLGRQASAAHLRRPGVPGSIHVALSPGGLPGGLRHERGAGGALRRRAHRTGHPHHHRRHELRLSVGQRQGGARPGRQRRGHVHHHRRRRHDRRGAHPLADARVPVPAVALWHEPRRSPPGRRHRGGGRPGGQAGRRRHAAGPQDQRARGRDAHPAGGHRPTLGLPAPRLDRPRRPGHQDHRIAGDHRLGANPST